MSESEHLQHLVEMDLARRAAVEGLDDATLGEAYAVVLGMLTPHLAETESGRALWWKAWQAVGTSPAARAARES